MKSICVGLSQKAGGMMLRLLLSAGIGCILVACFFTFPNTGEASATPPSHSTPSFMVIIPPASTKKPSLTPTPTTTGTPTLTPTITPTVVENSAISCNDLKSLELPDTEISISEIEWPGWSTPPMDFPNAPAPTVVDKTFCRVAGVIAPTIQFEVWLPLATEQNAWNGRFMGVGNVAMAGYIRYADLNDYLKSGYAAASTDTGHQTDPEDGRWMLHNSGLWVDYSYRAIHLMTLDAQAIVQAYYGRAPSYSYFAGCSGGGRQALIEAQRYPADYDGILAGAPSLPTTRLMPGVVWRYYVTNRSPQKAIPTNKLAAINQAALNACDADDGLADGVISDPLNCHFDPATLLCSGANASDCLTAGEVDSLKKVYAGLYDPTTGEQFTPGLEPGGELFWNTPMGFLYRELFGPPLNYFQYLLFADTPNWDWKTFDFTNPQDFAILYEGENQYGPTVNATSPDLSAFRERAGKLIIYQGWLDEASAPRNASNYYESVVNFMGEADAQDVLRLYMVPGMTHCAAGTVGLARPRALNALKQWVESGTSPGNLPAIDGHHRICPYPQVARYNGMGDPQKAESFTCTGP